MTLLLPAPPSFNYFVTNEDSPASSSTLGTLVTASGSTNTKGTWVAIHSTISYDLYVHDICLSAGGTGNATVRNFVDLGVGPDASNVTVKVENLCGDNTGGTGASAGFFSGGRNYLQVPLYVNAGTQLWARSQSNVASKTVRIWVNSWGAPDHAESFPKIGYIESIGESLGTTTGTAVTHGTSGTLGTSTSMGSFTNDVCALMLTGSSDNATLTAVGYVGALTTDATATVQELGLCMTMNGNASEEVRCQSTVVWADIPAGQTIGARLSCTGTGDTGMWTMVHGCVRA